MRFSKMLVRVALVFAVVALLSILLVHSANAVDLDGRVKTLNFLHDVAMLDLSKYNVTLRSDEVTYPEAYGGVPQERVRYILQTNDSYLDATCVFIDGKYYYCLLSWRSGSPIYVQPQSSNLVDVAKGIVERFQTYTGSSRYQPLRAILDLVSKAENTVVALDDFTLKVTANDRVTDLRWLYNVNGAETTALTLSLQDGALHDLGGAWNILSVSNAEVVLSQKEAIGIAVNSVQNFSWRTGDGVQINLTDPISEESTITQFFLTSRPPRDPFTLYPFWRVDLWLGKTYAGGVDHIAVGIWADTGEVSYIKALGGGLGGVSSDTPSDSPSSLAQSLGIPSLLPIPDSVSSPSPTPLPSQQPSDTSAPADSSSTENSSPADPAPPAALAIAAVVGVVAIGTIALYLKKKRFSK